MKRIINMIVRFLVYRGIGKLLRRFMGNNRKY